MTFVSSFGRQIPFSETSCNDFPPERANFKELLAINPNYFGNLPDSQQTPVFPLSSDTKYEQLKYIGFNAALSLLEATIQIKLSYSFDGDLCTNGSWEYVRFFVDYGTGWNGIGYVGVNVHDIANGRDCEKHREKPLIYTLSIPFQPVQNNCSIPVLPNIRAILSWNAIPTCPTCLPVWGNVVDQHIQAPPTTSNDIIDLVFGA